MAARSTQQHVDDALTALLGHDSLASPSGPIGTVLASIEKTPIICMIHLGGTGGDLRPFFNFVKALTLQLPARYYICLKGPVSRRHCQIPFALNLGKSVTLFDDTESFVATVAKLATVDAFIVNQIDQQSDRNLFDEGWHDNWHELELKLKKQDSVFIEIEHNWSIDALVHEIRRWLGKLQSNEASMADFGKWHAKAWPGASKGRKPKLPRLELMTYPLELLFSPEIRATTPILSGHIPPYRATTVATTLEDEVLAFVRERNLEGDKVILICRGGTYSWDCDLIPLANTLSEMPHTSYICQLTQGLDDEYFKRSREGRVMIVRGDLNHDIMFPAVDVVLHHGGAGTTMTALNSGIPQIIVPYICWDQLIQGAKILKLGCGILLRPRTQFHFVTSAES